MNDRKEIMKKKEGLTDCQVFMDKKFQNSMSSLAKAMCNGIKGVNVIFSDSGVDSFIAFTNGRKITLNVSNALTTPLPTKDLKLLSMVGLIAHECGHIRYTDFARWNILATQTENGKLEKPVEFISEEDEGFFDEMKNAVEDNKIARSVMNNILHHIANCLEDYYVEGLMCQEFPGNAKKGIALNSFRMQEGFDSLQTMIRKLEGDMPAADKLMVMQNLILSYVRYGTFNNWEGVTNEYTDFIYEISDCVNDALQKEEFYERYLACVAIAAHAWPAIKDMINEIQDNEDEEGNSEQDQEGSIDQGQSGSSNGNGGNDQGNNQSNGQSNGQNGNSSASGSNNQNSNNSSGNGKGKGVLKKETLSKSEEEKLNQILSVLTENAEKIAGGSEPDGKGKPCMTASDSERKNIPEIGSQIDNAIQESHMQEGGRFTTDGRLPKFMDSFEEEVDTEDPVGGNINSLLSDVMNRIAKDEVLKDRESALERSLRTELNEADLTRLHNVSRRIVRVKDIPNSYKSDYEMVKRDVMKTASRLADELIDVLTDKDGGIEDGLLIGKRVDRNSLYRKDGRVFQKEDLPDEGLELAVALVIDQSGSMSWGGRIESAKLTALVMYEFCQMLSIPICIYGHCDTGTVKLTSFAEFDSVDGNDRYRIMDLHAHGCNRDGLAVRFVADKLSKRPEENKILIVISDGQPNSDGYGGDIAKDDLMSAKLKYAKRGIVTFAAAIGDDRDVIKNIYGNGFLNISDIKSLPVKMTRLVQAFIK